MRKVISLFILVNFVLVSCGSSSETIATQNADTSIGLTPIWTTTPIPTSPVVPTETKVPVVVIHPEFSRKNQPEYIDHHEVVVEGITMNIDWGLTHWVMARPDYPIAEIHIAPDIAPMLGEIYLKSCWYRFTHFMPNNENVTYEEYVELVKQGEGDISFMGYDEVNGGARPVEIMIDPAEGFALSLVDQSLPIKINDLYSMYYGSDGTGRLFVAGKLNSTFIQKIETIYGDYCIDCPETALFDELYNMALRDLARLENRCLMSENVQSTCGYPDNPPEWFPIIEKMDDEEMKVLNGTRGPVFEVVEK